MVATGHFGLHLSIAIAFAGLGISARHGGSLLAEAVATSVTA
jgi:hypothetical protein